VHFYFDESGDYAFPENGFDCYVQVALICPDSCLGSCAEFVEARKERWETSELHGLKLTSEQRLDVARFIGDGSCQLLAYVTDTVVDTPKSIAEFRLLQAATIRRNLDWYRVESTKARGAPVAEIEDWMLRLIKRAGLASKISHGEFVQANYLIRLIAAGLQKAIFAYHEDQWRDDWLELRFILDGKLPAKMAAGERYLNDTLVPALGSQPGSVLSLPDTWQGDAKHPFVANCEREHGRICGQEVQGAIDLKAAFSNGLRFEDSRVHPGLQLVDVAANLVRRAVLRPEDAAIQEAFDAIRPKLRNLEGHSLTLTRLRAGDAKPVGAERYRPLYGPVRI